MMLEVGLSRNYDERDTKSTAFLLTWWLSAADCVNRIIPVRVFLLQYPCEGNANHWVEKDPVYL